MYRRITWGWPGGGHVRPAGSGLQGWKLQTTKKNPKPNSPLLSAVVGLAYPPQVEIARVADPPQGLNRPCALPVTLAARLRDLAAPQPTRVLQGGRAIAEDWSGQGRQLQGAGWQRVTPRT